MAAENDDNNNRVFYRRVFALVTLGIIAYLLFLVLRPFLSAIAWALLFAFLLHPAHERLTRLLNGRPNASAGLLTAGMLLVAIGPLTALGLAFARDSAVLLATPQTALGHPHRT